MYLSMPRSVLAAIIAAPLLLATLPETAEAQYYNRSYSSYSSYNYGNNGYYNSYPYSSSYRSPYSNSYYYSPYSNNYYRSSPGYYNRNSYNYGGSYYGTPRFGYSNYRNGGVIRIGPVQIPIN